MAKVIKRGDRHDRAQVARHKCDTCDSVVEYNRRVDLRDDQRDGAYVVCPVCGTWISARAVFR